MFRAIYNHKKDHVHRLHRLIQTSPTPAITPLCLRGRNRRPPKSLGRDDYELAAKNDLPANIAIIEDKLERER